MWIKSYREYADLYVLYFPDQQLPQIKPTFPPIFLAITRCAAIERSLLPAVNLISSVIDVLSRHVLVMGTVASRTILVRHVRTTSCPVMSRANRQPRSTHRCERSKSTVFSPPPRLSDRSTDRVLKSPRKCRTWKSLRDLCSFAKFSCISRARGTSHKNISNSLPIDR